MELNEEEKKAIKDFLELREIHSNDSMSVSYLSIYQNAVKKMLNLFEKQQKEIEDYKQLIFYFKDKLNNIDFETETGWRKIEKFEKIYGEIFGELEDE